MINVDYIHSLSYFIAAKQLTAFPSPDEWNSYAALSNIDLFNFYNDEREKLLLEIKSGEQIFAPETLSDFVVNEYPMSPSTMSPSLPNDYIYDIAFKTTIGGVNKTIKKVAYNKLESYLNSTIDLPTAINPIYVELANNMQLYPTLYTPTYLTYYRLPVTPVWGYTMVNNRPVYNPATSVNFEWQPTETTRLVSRILGYMGMSIRDSELEQYAQQMTQQAS